MLGPVSTEVVVVAFEVLVVESRFERMVVVAVPDGGCCCCCWWWRCWLRWWCPNSSVECWDFQPGPSSSELTELPVGPPFGTDMNSCDSGISGGGSDSSGEATPRDRR